MAEYRYGREEMLSLFDKNFKQPELLPKYNKLFIEKMQCPLALLPPTADEDSVSLETVMSLLIHIQIQIQIHSFVIVVTNVEFCRLH